MTGPQRIGVFGGTFDPIHNAHLDIARAAQAAAGLDLVLFVVSARPPHKTGETFAAPEQRLAMVEAALADCAGMEASSLEIEREGPSYTAETLMTLKAQYPGASLFLIMGFDSLVDLPRWKDPETILSTAELLVVARPGRENSVAAQLNGKYRVVPFEETDISSTDIRRRIAEGEPVDELMPNAVFDVIKREGLYNVEAARGARR